MVMVDVLLVESWEVDQSETYDELWRYKSFFGVCCAKLLTFYETNEISRNNNNNESNKREQHGNQNERAAKKVSCFIINIIL